MQIILESGIVGYLTNDLYAVIAAVRVSDGPVH